jgi:hypothetical protein
MFSLPPAHLKDHLLRLLCPPFLLHSTTILIYVCGSVMIFSLPYLSSVILRSESQFSK